MEKKLAVIVDNNEEITTGAGNTEMCSCGTDVVMEMCSPESHDTCGSRHMSTKGEFVEIIEFTHFARIFKFNRTPGIGKKKEIFHEVKVSVGFELV